MKATLYDIEKEYLELVNQAEELEGVLTPELEEALTITEAQRDGKSIAYVEIIGSKESFVDRVKKERDRYNAIIKREENTINRLKSKLLGAVTLFGDYNVGLVKFGTRKSTSVEVLGEVNSLPSEFKTVKVTESADKAAIKLALKAGIDVAGCSIVERLNLKIN